ncbi:MAG TPA: glycoside hydrolase family 3 N-terminal domain-containing protein [Candidatus Acidoferrales bacterium]|nr:glycoside hydrolase family 3 N-terminal domain-containing protein [Candidatus Acidoferrales bacterium]
MPTTGRLIHRRDVLRAGLAAGAAFLAGCVAGRSPGSSPLGSVAPASVLPSLLIPATPGPVVTAGPPAATLRQAIASLLIVGFRGFTVETAGPITSAIADDWLGGVILFSHDQKTGGRRNITSPDQLRALTSGLSDLAGDRGLIVSIDQEGGVVSRLSPANGFPAFESEATIGASRDPAVALDFGQRLGATLADIGVNLDFAPVVDVNVNPTNPAIGALDRSFSADPDMVATLADAEIEGLHQYGIATTLKHFPGLGSATVNTDNGIADVSRTWTDSELVPYRRLIGEGVLDAIMAGHVIVKPRGGPTPASLSPAIVTDLLRGQLGWGGVVVTDDLGAVAITSTYGFEEALALAIEAGNDLLLLANQNGFDSHLADRAIDAIAAHVASGRISRDRIEESRARVAVLMPGQRGD